MTITHKNLTEQYPKLKVSIPQPLKDTYDSTVKMLPHYGKSEVIDKRINLYVEKLNELVDKHAQNDGGNPTSKPDTKAKSKKATPKKKAPKKAAPQKITPKKEKKTVIKVSPAKKNSKAETIPEAKALQKRVYLMDEEIKLINSYYLLNGKEKTKKQFANLLKRAEKVMQSSNLDEKAIIKHIHEQIKKLFNSIGDNEYAVIKMADADVAKYKDIVNLNKIKLNLTIEQLNGLGGTTNIPRPKRQRINLAPGKIISSADFRYAEFKTMGFTGNWKRLIGDPAEPFRVMIYGQKGSGKSTLTIKLAKYLAAQHAMRAIFVSGEEKFGYTLQEKFSRLNAYDANLDITDTLKTDFSKYDVIILDSLTTLQINAELMQHLYKKYPNKSFIVVNQCTKEGKFRGEEELAHDVDVLIKVEGMKAWAEKSRFGGRDVVPVL